MAGFHAEGGGLVTARIEPARPMPPLDLTHRGVLREVELLSLTGGLDAEVGALQAARAARALRALGVAAEVERLPVPVHGSAREPPPGAGALRAVHLRSRRGGGAGAAAGRGGRGGGGLASRPTSRRAGRSTACSAAQLRPPGGAPGGGAGPGPAGLVPATRYTVSEVTGPLLAVAEVVPRFLAVEVAVVGRAGRPGEVRVQPAGGPLGVLPLTGGPA